jgi:hypothetical protein
MTTTCTLTLEQKLAETMSKLETALLSPVIAGEFSQWVHAVQESAATLTVDLTSLLHTVLHVQYKEIAKTDLEMATQVEKLIAGDKLLLEQLTRFHEDLHALAAAAEIVERDELKLDGLRERVEEKGVTLILAIKKQQAAANTWLSEAHFRDRGVKD